MRANSSPKARTWKSRMTFRHQRFSAGESVLGEFDALDAFGAAGVAFMISESVENADFIKRTPERPFSHEGQSDEHPLIEGNLLDLALVSLGCRCPYDGSLRPSREWADRTVSKKNTFPQ